MSPGETKMTQSLYKQMSVDCMWERAELGEPEGSVRPASLQ